MKRNHIIRYNLQRMEICYLSKIKMKYKIHQKKNKNHQNQNKLKKPKLNKNKNLNLIKMLWSKNKKAT